MILNKMKKMLNFHAIIFTIGNVVQIDFSKKIIVLCVDLKLKNNYNFILNILI